MERKKKFDFDKIKDRARGLRENMTEAERILWNELRGRRLEGFKFLRQHPVLYQGNLKRYNYFIADFYCSEKKAIIELDGPVHESTKEYDQFRDSELRELGFKILRIKNEELVSLPEVKKKIVSFLDIIS